MSENNQELTAAVEIPAKPLPFKVKWFSHDSRAETSEELDEIYDDAENFWVIRDNHYWRENAAEFVREERPGMIVLNNLPAGSPIEAVSYYLPDAAGTLRKGYDHDPYVLACGLSFAAIPDGPIKESLEKMREKNAYNWDDPGNEDIPTKIKELFYDKSRQTAFKTAVHMGLMTYAPWLIPAQLATRTKLPFQEYLSKRSMPTGRLTTFLADKSPVEISPKIVSLLHRWSRFPFMGTADLDFQRALMCLQTADAIEAVGQENIHGDVVALLPNYEKKAQYLVEDVKKQEEIVRKGVEEFISIFTDLSEASGVSITREHRDQLVQVAAAYLGSIEVRRIEEQMRENETVNQTEKHMPIVYQGVSRTIQEIIEDVAEKSWSVDENGKIQENEKNGSSLLSKIGVK